MVKEYGWAHAEALMHVINRGLDGLDVLATYNHIPPYCREVIVDWQTERGKE